MLLVVCCILAVQYASVTFGGSMFRCVPLSLTEWLVIIVATSPVLLIGEVYRLLCRNHTNLS